MITAQACRVCGCTDENCTQCVLAQGYPCHWAAAGLCSRCANARHDVTAADIVGVIRRNVERAGQLAAGDGDLVDVAGCIDVAYQETETLPLEHSADIERWAHVRHYLDQAQRWVRVWENGSDASARTVISVLCRVALGYLEGA